MAKYVDAVQALNSVFAGNEWLSKSGNLQIVPQNFFGVSFNDEFVRYEVIPSRPLNLAYGNFSIGGQIIFSIFVTTGGGPKRSMEIADLLDEFFETKHLDSNVHTGTSALTFIGVDPDDNSLFRADYTIPFNKY